MILKRFRFNIIFKTLGELAARLSSLVFYAMGARLLGAEEFGLFSLAYSYAFIIAVIIEMGMNNILTRELARSSQSSSRLIPAVLNFKLMATPIGFVLVHFVMVALGYDRRLVYLTDLMCIVAVGTAFSEFISAVLSGLEKMDIEAGVKTVWKIMPVFVSYFAFKIYGTLESFIVGMGIGIWIGVALGFIWIHLKVAPFNFKWDGKLFKKFLTMSAPLFLAWMFIFVYDNQDLYILSALSFRNENIGLFSASAKLIDALRPIPVLLMGAAFPILAEAALKDPKAYTKIVRSLLTHAVVILFPSVLLLSTFSKELTHLIYGVSYDLSAPVFSIAIWGFVGIFLNHLLFQLLVSLDGQKQFLFGAVMVTAFNALFCYMLMPKYGIAGGAMALVGAEVILLFYNFVAVCFRLKQGASQLISDFSKPWILSLACGILILLLEKILGPVGALTLSIGLFLFLAFQLKLIDWNLIKRLRK